MTDSTLLVFWKKCSSCKKEITYQGRYYICSVSTCNTKKLGLVFCSVSCWDAHLGFANHRSSEAVENTAPSKSQCEKAFLASPDETANISGRRIILRATETSATSTDDIDTLVVVSKIKKLIRDRSDFNVSQCCIDALTDKVVQECLKGIETARAAGRKTVMGRDIL